MARPVKKGLGYFPKDTDFYDDPKIIELLERHGALGVAVYDIILTMVYKNGYYLEMSESTLASVVVRVIGNRWAKRELVSQVIHSCAELDLIDRISLTHGVITSVAIQRRFSEIARRSKADMTKHWLLKEPQQPSESVPEKKVFAEKTKVSAVKTTVFAEKTQQIKMKVNENVNENDLAAHTRVFSEFELAFQKLIGTRDREILLRLVGNYPDDDIISAIRLSAKRGAHSAAYAEKILQSEAAKRAKNAPPDYSDASRYAEEIKRYST